eukprot:s43_g5.t2
MDSVLVCVGNRRGLPALAEWLQVLVAKMHGDRCRSQSSSWGSAAGALGTRAPSAAAAASAWQAERECWLTRTSACCTALCLVQCTVLCRLFLCCVASGSCQRGGSSSSSSSSDNVNTTCPSRPAHPQWLGVCGEGSLSKDLACGQRRCSRALKGDAAKGH